MHIRLAKMGIPSGAHDLEVEFKKCADVQS